MNDKNLDALVAAHKLALADAYERGKREGEKPWKEAAQAAYDVLTVAPELNPSNYDHDQVCDLNSKALEAWSILDATVNPKPLPAQPGKAKCGTGDKT